MFFAEHKDTWKQAFLNAGHTFKLKEPDEDDGPDGPDIDWFALSDHMHNGPECTTCGWKVCKHCTKASDIPKCQRSVGISKMPHNAGQSIDVPNVVVGPVTTIDFGTITVAENWGRLFIKQGDKEIMILQSAYEGLIAAIKHFVEPKT